MSILARHADDHPTRRADDEATPRAVLIRWRIGVAPGMDDSTLELRAERRGRADGVLSATLIERNGAAATERSLLDNEQIGRASCRERVSDPV